MKKLLLANWKMNLSVAESTGFLSELLHGACSVRELDGVELVLAPSFLALDPMRRMDAEGLVGLCAQDAYFVQSGAYCGAISPKMLKEVCEYVCIGHSERRIYFGDTDEIVRDKVRACAEMGMKIVLCIGESADCHRLGLTREALRTQMSIALDGMNRPELLTLLYEPTWALGTGKALQPEEANALCAYLHAQLRELFGAEKGDAIRVIYAGSVSAANAAAYAAQEHIDGAALGSAAVRPDTLIPVIKAFSTTCGVKYAGTNQ